MKEKMKTVLSASRRTDLPRFYYEWLQQALKKGDVELANPRFQDRTYRVDLKPEKVHSIVLWSKDFHKVAEEPGYLSQYNLYFQYTVNHYSRRLEPNVPEFNETIRTLERLLKNYRPEQFNIRFDPVILSTVGEVEPTPEKPGKARLEAFEKLCRSMKSLGMQGCRLTTSYLCYYPHVQKRMQELEGDIVKLSEDRQRLFFERMVEIADKYGLPLYSCASPVLMQVPGMKKGSCIDGQLLEQLFGGKVSRAADAGQRKHCGCSRSREIGEYKPCGHGCIYCYSMPV